MQPVVVTLRWPCLTVLYIFFHRERNRVDFLLRIVKRARPFRSCANRSSFCDVECIACPMCDARWWNRDFIIIFLLLLLVVVVVVSPFGSVLCAPTRVHRRLRRRRRRWTPPSPLFKAFRGSSNKDLLLLLL